jgi:hypothetical protein
MEKWRVSGDLDNAEIDDDWEDVEEVEREETRLEEGPLPRDADLGWQSEGLLSDHEPTQMPSSWRVFLYVAGMAAIAGLVILPLIVILLY